MGLDMYFSKKKFIWSDDRGKLKISGIDGIRSNKVKEIVEEAGYWRKANQIHKWFVDHIQDGNDNCAEYYVSEENMEILLETVNKVLDASELVDGKIINGFRYKDGKEEPIFEDGQYIKDPTVAKELLPVQSGFFFGSEQYNQWYYEDLVNTKKILEEALEEDDGEYYYQSSW